MTENPNQPRAYDVVMGGQNLPPIIVRIPFVVSFARTLTLFSFTLLPFSLLFPFHFFRRRRIKIFF